MVDRLAKSASGGSAAIEVEVEIKGGGDPYIVIPPGKPGSTGQESALMKRAFPILEDCVNQQFGSKPIYLREGGSIPIIQDLKEVVVTNGPNNICLL